MSDHIWYGYGTGAADAALALVLRPALIRIFRTARSRSSTFRSSFLPLSPRLRTGRASLPCSASATACSSQLSRLRRMAWVWGYQSAGRSSSHMLATSSRTNPSGGRIFQFTARFAELSEDT